ncbi:MAG: portal protein [Rhodospirillaceae bacterium]
MADTSERGSVKYLVQRVGQLKSERNSFDSHWKDLSEYVMPRRSRFITSSRNSGERGTSKIINSTATWALRVATSGLLAGVMSPARPWFKLEAPEQQINEMAGVPEWLEFVSNRMRQVFNASNLYRQAPMMFSELLQFGTGCITHVDDFDDVARFYAHTVGSYVIDCDERGMANVLAREFEMTAAQMAQRFGYDKVSDGVRNALDRGDYSTWFQVSHLIEPTDGWKPGNPFSKRYTSYYFEPGKSGLNTESLLEKSGFSSFPAYCPRWETTGEDVYGTNCPGMTALGDTIALQLLERRKAMALDKLVNPPLRGPASLRNARVSTLPGGVNIYDTDGTGAKLEPIYQVSPDLQHMGIEIERHERRIKEDYFVDLFRAISDMEGIQPRNQLDLIQRNEERLLQLGPVLESVLGEFLSPLIDRTFEQMMSAGILPEAPEALSGSELKVEYISPLVVAQRSVAAGSIERLTGFIGGLAQLGYQEALQKFDPMQAVDEYARAVGVPARVVVPDEIAQQKVAALQQQAAAARALEQGQQVANMAKMAADAKTDETDPNLLTDSRDALAGQPRERRA